MKRGTNRWLILNFRQLKLFRLLKRRRQRLLVAAAEIWNEQRVYGKHHKLNNLEKRQLSLYIYLYSLCIRDYLRRNSSLFFFLLYCESKVILLLFYDVILTTRSRDLESIKGSVLVLEIISCLAIDSADTVTLRIVTLSRQNKSLFFNLKKKEG